MSLNFTPGAFIKLRSSADARIMEKLLRKIFPDENRVLITSFSSAGETVTRFSRLSGQIIFFITLLAVLVGGLGIANVMLINITEKTGPLIAVRDVTDSDDLMIINKSGIIIRMAIADLRIVGRATQGVRLIKINEGDAIAAVTKVEVEEGAEPDETIDADQVAEGENDAAEPVNPAENEEN